MGFRRSSSRCSSGREGRGSTPRSHPQGQVGAAKQSLLTSQRLPPATFPLKCSCPRRVQGSTC